MNRKTMILPISLIAMSLVGAACSSSKADSGTSPASAGGTKTFADMATVSNAFTTCVQKNYKTQVAAVGYKAFPLYNNFTPATAQTNLDTVLTKTPEVALYTSFNPQYDVTSVNKLETAGIKTVVLLGDTPPGTKPHGVLNANPAAYATDTIAELLKQKPDTKELGLIPGSLTSAASIQADDALTKAAEAKGLKVVAIIASNYLATGGQKAAQDMLQAHPEIDAILSIGDDASLAAARVAKASGKDVPVVDVYSFSDAALNAVKSGDILFAMWQKQAEWGQMIAQSIKDAGDGKFTPEKYLALSVVNKLDAGSTPSNGC